MFKIVWDKALSAFLYMTLVLAIIGWIAFSSSRTDGVSYLAGRDRIGLVVMG